jgi:ABC-type transport system involved in cytochrome c biogenesis ATPase subunit
MGTGKGDSRSAEGVEKLEEKNSGKMDDTYHRRKVNKGHHNGIKPQRVMSEELKGLRLRTVSSISTAWEYKPVNGAPNLTLNPSMFLKNETF